MSALLVARIPHPRPHPRPRLTPIPSPPISHHSIAPHDLPSAGDHLFVIHMALVHLTYILYRNSICAAP